MSIRIVFFLLVLAVPSISHAKKHSFAPTRVPKKFSGDKNYTPTKLEWLTSINRNECGLWLGGIPSVSWGLFNPLRQKDTISIEVRFNDEKVRTQAQQAAETCERNIKALSSARGWKWLKTEVNVSNRKSDLNPKGFLISKILPKGPFTQLGLKSGDIIQTVNFKPISSKGDALIIETLLKQRKTIRVQYSREGRTRLRSLRF